MTDPSVRCSSPEAELVHEWGVNDGPPTAYVAPAGGVWGTFTRECRTRFGVSEHRCACGVFTLRPFSWRRRAPAEIGQ